MKIKPHLAIAGLCTAIDSLPEARRQESINIACLFVGRISDPTGLEPQPGRTPQQLFWTPTIKELEARLIQLVEEQNINERVIVLGVTGSLEVELAMHADQDFSNQGHEHLQSTIDNLKIDLAKPQEERSYTEDGLEDFIRDLEKKLEAGDQRRQEAEDALSHFRQKTTDFSTVKFWKAIDEHKQNNQQ